MRRNDMEDRFLPMVEDRNWHSSWSHNGELVRDGDVFEVRWPDGSTTTEKVSVEKRHYTVSDMGQPYTCTSDDVRIFAIQHGVEFMTDVRTFPDLLFRRVR